MNSYINQLWQNLKTLNFHFSISSELLLVCGEYFFITLFVAYGLRKAHVFFKPFLFLFLVLWMTKAYDAGRAYISISATVAVLLVYAEVIQQKIIDTLELSQDVYYKIKDLFIAFFEAVIGLFRFLFAVIFFPFKLIFGLLAFFIRPLQYSEWNWKFGRAKRDNAEPFYTKPSENSTAQPNMDDVIREAKEQFRRARGDKEDAGRQQQRQDRHETNTESPVKPSNSSDTRTPYEILGVSKNFTREELDRAYKMLASRFHPDKYSQMSKSFRKEAEQELVKVSKAYNELLASLD